jgi:hypothetical protein
MQSLFPLYELVRKIVMFIDILLVTPLNSQQRTGKRFFKSTNACMDSPSVMTGRMWPKQGFLVCFRILKLSARHLVDQC